MQAIARSIYTQAALLGTSRRLLMKAAMPTVVHYRSFAAEVEVKKQTAAEVQVEVDQRNKRLGVDTVFSEQKHAYVLSFPWNYPQIISNYEEQARPVASFWHKFVMNNATYEMNKSFREFHQACALPDYGLLDMVCEPKLAQYVKESVRRIQFHGLDIEMANLTVEQPKLKLLKVEVSHGVSVTRSGNKPASEYTQSKGSLLGAPQTVFIPKEDTRDFLDHLNYNHKPYVVAATLLIESPMKLFVQNQNYSAVLFGSKDEELVKNIVRFETQVRWLDLFKLLPVENKTQFGWKITDFNNVLNENPILPQY